MSEDRDERDESPHPSGIFFRIVQRIEELLFAAILLTIVGLGLLPVILRSFFDSGVTWAEPLTRQMVLWLALFGAGAATQDRKHISIDVVGNFLPPRWKLAFRSFTGLFSALICGLFTWVSVQFVQDEREFGYMSTVSSSIPEWVFELALPIGFCLLTIRFLIAVIQDAVDAIRNKNLPD